MDSHLFTPPDTNPYQFAIDETLVFDENEFAEFLQMSPFRKDEAHLANLAPPSLPPPPHAPHQPHQSHQSHQQAPPQQYYDEAPPIHLYPPEPDRRPQMSLAMPQPNLEYQSAPGQVSPYYGPLSAGPLSSAPLHSGSSGSMTEYFPPQFNSTHPHPYMPRRPNQSKTGRQQFSACGACRHRRVKCDLKEKQDKLESGKAACTNCEERGVTCIDEYAPLKAAKQLRRGKRISEIEVLYGKPTSKGKEKALPELSREFFDSNFFRRFQVQRPVLDPQDFVQRYLAASSPCAALMGPEGAVLCHVLYAWAVSYGVDEHGQLDVPEGGGEPLGVLSVAGPSYNELRREADREVRREKMRHAVKVILREIDDVGILRKPTWDGVRVLLLVLPLTEGVSTPVERLAMYEAALNQVYALCSFGGMGYDGQPAATSGVNGGVDSDGRQNVQLVRVRIYWYAFVHEGITTGLKGGRLHLDDEDLETMQDTIQNRAVVVSSTTSFRTSVKFATAPIHLALACRLINRALTGPSARRNAHVNGERVKQAWEALERSWEEFESLKYEPDALALYKSMDDVVRFADGWKIFLFEAQNVIRRILEERFAKLQADENGGGGAYISQHPSPEEQSEAVHLRHLVDISRSKCEVQTRQIIDMVRHHVGSRFFEWDASLVRDGTFYAAKLLHKLGGTDEEMGYCLQALNELRWAHAKAPERSAELRSDWAVYRQVPWDPDYIVPESVSVPSNPSHSGSASPLYSPVDGLISPGYYTTTPLAPGNGNPFDAAMGRVVEAPSHPPGLGQLYIQQGTYDYAPQPEWVKSEPGPPPAPAPLMQGQGQGQGQAPQHAMPMQGMSLGVGAAMRGYTPQHQPPAHTLPPSHHVPTQHHAMPPHHLPPPHHAPPIHQQPQSQLQQQQQQQQQPHAGQMYAHMPPPMGYPHASGMGGQSHHSSGMGGQSHLHAHGHQHVHHGQHGQHGQHVMPMQDHQAPVQQQQPQQQQQQQQSMQPQQIQGYYGDTSGPPPLGGGGFQQGYYQ